MADEKISDLPAASSVADADIAPIVQGGTNKKSALSVIKTYVQAAFDSIYVPLSRTLNIGGSSQSLAANRTWTTNTILEGIGSPSQGDILYRGASNWVLLTAGTNGFQLTTHGAGANPTWAASAASGAALTKTDDTNVTLTLGGSPTTALVNSSSLTLGWTGTLSVARGGSGAGTLTGVLIGNGTSAFTTLTAPSGTIVGTTDTQTLTNKRVTPRVTTITSSATPTINTDNCDAVTITALAAAISTMSTNLSGAPNNFDKLIFRIKDDGNARALAWGASFVAKGVALPTTTVVSKLLTVGFIYDTVATTWGCVASSQET